MSIEEMLLGYTINGAKQLGIEDTKGSIETGKDADYLVFDNDLLTAEHGMIAPFLRLADAGRLKLNTTFVMDNRRI